jgi:hypothetical protein
MHFMEILYLTYFKERLFPQRMIQVALHNGEAVLFLEVYCIHCV